MCNNHHIQSYINSMSLPRSRVWIRFRARAIAGVKVNFRHSYVKDMACRFCAQGSDETQEHLQLCGGMNFERRGFSELESTFNLHSKYEPPDTFARHIRGRHNSIYHPKSKKTFKYIIEILSMLSQTYSKGYRHIQDKV